MLEITHTKGVGGHESDALHQQLGAYYGRKLAPALPPDDREFERSLYLDQVGRQLERTFLLGEQADVKRLVSSIPTEPDRFVDWYLRQRDVGPGQWDTLFEWIADRASLQDMRWFVRQELVGEAGFDDLVALTQVRMPTTPKLEMARNYWDEMGRGRENAMHGPMLARTGEVLDAADPSLGPLLWQARALGNLHAALATNRAYAYHSIGALGAVELTAPTRTEKVAQGLTRLGVAKPAVTYFALHATVDVLHSEAWVKEVVRPLIEDHPACMRAIGEGLLMRLNAGASCFDAYRRHFGLVGKRARFTSTATASC